MINYHSVFILGNPRSGTSLFRLMLNSHPNITAPPESGFAHWLLPKYKDWKFNDNDSNRLMEFLSDLSECKKIETWEISYDRLKKTILKYKPLNYSELIAIVYLSYSKKYIDNQIIVDKNNYYIHHIDEIQKIWPNSKFIHLVRDGRDVACSYIDVINMSSSSPYKPKLPSSIEKIAKEWCENNIEIAKIKENFPKQYLLVKYEDIVLDTKNELIKVCAFLNVEYNDEMMNYHSTNSRTKMEPALTMDWKLKTREKPDPNNVFRYRENLNNEQIRIFETYASEILVKYGYK